MKPGFHYYQCFLNKCYFLCLFAIGYWTTVLVISLLFRWWYSYFCFINTNKQNKPVFYCPIWGYREDLDCKICSRLVSNFSPGFFTMSARGEGGVQTRYRISGKGQLKEKAGFLVSESLTLPFSLRYLTIFHDPLKKLNVFSRCFLSLASRTSIKNLEIIISNYQIADRNLSECANAAIVIYYNQQSGPFATEHGSCLYTIRWIQSYAEGQLYVILDSIMPQSYWHCPEM